VRRRIKKLGVASYLVPSISRELRGLEELVKVGLRSSFLLSLLSVDLMVQAGQRGEVRYSEESSSS